jgi:hypothetical protein
VTHLAVSSADFFITGSCDGNTFLQSLDLFLTKGEIWCKLNCFC